MPKTKVFCCLMIIIFISEVPSGQTEQYYHQSDGCDWEGSGSHSDSERVVTPVYLRCSHGTIKWFSPRGGLRIVLKHGTSNKDFKGCIRMAKNVSSVRMYIEGHRKLHHLYSVDDGKHIDLLRCFVSNNGKVALFIESETTNILNDMVQLSYDLQSVSSKRDLLDEYEECRPCDDSQMISLFCTSDFIIQGTISSLFHNQELERSELTIRASSVIKDPVNNLFVINNSSSNDIANNHYGIIRYITLYRPLKCGTKAGSGTEFLFFGRWILGNPVISCAPKLTYWKHVKSKAMENGSYQCQLD